jgi:hypothetical protein
MYAEFYSQNPLLFWPLVGLAIFLVSFTAVLMYVLIGLRDRRKVDYLANLPLESEPDSAVHIGDAFVPREEV